MAKFADRLIALGLILLGFVMVVTPLALWVAWTDTILLAVLATGVAAGVLYCVLVRFERPATPAQVGTAGDVRVENLPEKMIRELQKLHPFIHHHRPSGGPKFRAAMLHMKRYLYRDPDG